MKRKLLILSILLLGLWVVCLFYPGRNPAIHIALIVELVFFIHYLVIKKSPALIETSEAVVMNEHEQETEPDNEIERNKSDLSQTHVTVNKQEVEVFS